MKEIIKTAIVISIIFFIASCGPKGEDVNVSGKGGSAVLHIFPEHDQEAIDSCTIYIKYNSLDADLFNQYDDSIKCNLVDGKQLGVFTGLRKGNYYLLGTAKNTTHNTVVRGGMPFAITEQDKIYSFPLHLGH